MCGETEVTVQAGLEPCDPHKTPVLIIGQQKHLAQLSYSDIACKLKSRVTQEIWNHGVKSLQPSPTDTVSLYLNLCSVAALPTKVSRHNTESRAHSITKIVRSQTVAADEEYIVLVCERSSAYASVCAAARAYPLYSRKSSVLKSKRRQKVIIEVVLSGSTSTTLDDDDIRTMKAAIYGLRLAARIVDTPANEMTTIEFLKEIREVGKKLDIVPLVYEGEELRKMGMGGLYGVGKAASTPPVLAVLSHRPEGATKRFAWVGKGIVYDTGGLSMKTKTTMPGMKRDCGGAAAVLGAFYHAVTCGFKEDLCAIFCLAENAVGPDATKPDDIHKLYSGRTVEINNTDAEGRLVLGDGVAYALQDKCCDVIVDMATLTGAQATATGKYHAAILTNCPEMEECCVKAGRSSGELNHPLVYTPELHFHEFASAVADMKNSAADRNNAASSCAGLFIGAQLGFDYPGKWLHIDMASPVCMGERATGYGSSLLPVLFGEYTESQLLKSLAPKLPKIEHISKNNNKNDDVDNNGDMEPVRSATGKSELQDNDYPVHKKSRVQ